MSLEPQFLRDVQRAGWDIRSVDPTGVIAGCPRQGCSLTVKLRSGVKIPETCRRGPDFRETPVANFDAARVALRDRRRALALSVEDVEHIAGVTASHLAKAEKDNPSRIVQMNIFLEWCDALGIEVVLRPKELPALALTIIARTRHLSEARRRQSARQRAP